MRHLHTKSHFRHALFALQDADGYVEALFDMARDQVSGRRFPLRPSTLRLHVNVRKDSVRGRAHAH